MFFERNAGGISWLVVFLGNPGPRYAGTRHNVGFMTAEYLEKRTGVRLTRLRFQALTAKWNLGGEGVLAMKPQTYMNLSGDAVAPAASFYKLPPERILVVSDDVALPLGKLRIRTKGSAGGHNGLKSIIARLGSETFPRIRIGVGAPPRPDYDMADWVLGTFQNQEAVDIADACARAAQAVETYICDGPEKAMQTFN